MWPSNFQHLQRQYRWWSNAEEQRRGSAWDHQKGSRTHVCHRELPKTTKALFSWIPWVPLASNAAHLHSSCAVWQQSLQHRRQAPHLTCQTPSPPFSRLQTPHGIAKEPARFDPILPQLLELCVIDNGNTEFCLSHSISLLFLIYIWILAGGRMRTQLFPSRTNPPLRMDESRTALKPKRQAALVGWGGCTSQQVVKRGSTTNYKLEATSVFPLQPEMCESGLWACG